MIKASYDLDIKPLYGNLFSAEYEKANIWPIGSAVDGIAILSEECKEAYEAARKLDQYFLQVAYPEDRGDSAAVIPTAWQMRNLEGFAVTAICELLQVIAVCRKYGAVFEEAQGIYGDGMEGEDDE